MRQAGGKKCRPCRAGRCEDCTKWEWKGIDTCWHECASDKDQLPLFPVGEVSASTEPPRTPDPG